MVTGVLGAPGTVGGSVEMGAGVNDLTVFPTNGDPMLLAPSQTDPYTAECAYFVDCIRQDTPADRATPADALHALAVALAARASLERGGEPVVVTT